MRRLARESAREGVDIGDKVLNAWLRALNQEHKREDSSKDFATETSGRLHLERVTILPPEVTSDNKFDEQIHNLSGYLDGTGTIRNRLLGRRLDRVQVPVTVSGVVSTYGTFSFGIGPSDDAPKAGPHESGVELGLERYGGLGKLWNKMKTHTVGDLVGNNKPGGRTDDVQGSKND